MSLLTLLLGAGVLAVLQDSPSFCPAVQQLVDLIHHPEVQQQFLPLVQRLDSLLLLHLLLFLVVVVSNLLLLLLLLLFDLCSFGIHRHTGRRRLQRDAETFDSICFDGLTVYVATRVHSLYICNYCH